MRFSSLPLLWRVFAINAALLVVATLLLALTPATVHARIAIVEGLDLAAALVVMLAANLVLLRHTLRPIDRLIERMRKIDLLRPGQRIPEQGGVEVANGLVLPYARLFILGFCAAAVVGVVLLIGRTRIGLLLRATTQNRPMAAALGVGTRRIDGFAFALGSGIAGMAGCALTLISNITPNMGQELVVDSFLVVVVGGVGKLIGVGSLTKLFEPWTQGVWAKVLVLMTVIAFIQWRPSGFFPQKGRLSDA